MPTKPKASPYHILFADSTLLTYDLTVTDYKALSDALVHGRLAVALSIGTLGRLSDIRHVIKAREPEPAAPDSAAPYPESPEWYKYLEEQAEDEEDRRNFRK